MTNSQENFINKKKKFYTFNILFGLKGKSTILVENDYALPNAHQCQCTSASWEKLSEVGNPSTREIRPNLIGYNAWSNSV